MKKMKLFATVSVLCLGIAAVANTQAHSRANIDGYKDNGAGECTTKVALACQDVNGTDCVDGGGAPLYRQNASACSIRLKKP